MYLRTICLNMCFGFIGGLLLQEPVDWWNVGVVFVVGVLSTTLAATESARRFLVECLGGVHHGCPGCDCGYCNGSAHEKIIAHRFMVKR